MDEKPLSVAHKLAVIGGLIGVAWAGLFLVIHLVVRLISILSG